MHLDISVVANQAQLTKLVQEKAHPGSRRSDHLRQGCLIDRSIDWRWLSIFSEIGQQKEKARESLLARIKQLVDQKSSSTRLLRVKRHALNISENFG